MRRITFAPVTDRRRKSALPGHQADLSEMPDFGT